MKRVLVIGCAGAGKSTFTRGFGARTGLPVVHLDHLYWRPGWEKTPAEEWRQVVRGLVAAERWLMDGSYGGTIALRLEAADTAIFLDLSRRTCFRRVVVRSVRGRGRTRSDLAPGCPEQLDLGFLRWVWSYPSRHRPNVVEQLAAFERRGGRVIVLRSSAEARAFLDSTPSAAAGEGAAVSIAGQ